MNKLNQLRKKNLPFAIINARSLAPKLASLTEHFEEYEWALAVVSETWFVEGPIFDETVRELSLGHGLETISQNRKPKHGRNSGGGVSIIWRKSKIRLKVYPSRKNGCEIVTAKGKFTDCNRTVYICLLYTSPSPRDRTRSRMPSSA